jgi:hypothetical protein
MQKRQTPWGPADSCVALSKDNTVLKVGTPEHGGIGVAPSVELPQHIHECALVDHDGWRWFEEDIAWSAAAIALPEFFDEKTMQAAKDTLRHCMPRTFMAHFGVLLTGATSRALAQEEFESATKSNFIVVHEFGDLYWNVPEGHVYACGWRRADEATCGFLVPIEKYRNPSRLVLDEFPRWEPDRSLPFCKPKVQPEKGPVIAT